MGDKLTQLYDQFMKGHAGEIDLFQAFQAGFTVGAVLMRQRAVKIAQDKKDRNDVINSIGQLPDIPQ